MSTDPLFMKVGSQYYWYHNDHLGTPQMMTTSSGAVVWKAKYTTFGKATVDSSSTVVNPFRFPGQYEDSETGLYYNLLRYYQPEVGRYLTIDPIGFRGGSLNLYVYVQDNPIGSYDPDGAVALKKLFEMFMELVLHYGKEHDKKKRLEDAKDRKRRVLLFYKNLLANCYNEKQKWYNGCKSFCKKTYTCVIERGNCYGEYCAKTFLEKWKECRPIVEIIEEIELQPVDDFYPFLEAQN